MFEHSNNCIKRIPKYDTENDSHCILLHNNDLMVYNAHYMRKQPVLFVSIS